MPLRNGTSYLKPYVLPDVLPNIETKLLPDVLPNTLLNIETKLLPDINSLIILVKTLFILVMLKIVKIKT